MHMSIIIIIISNVSELQLPFLFTTTDFVFCKSGVLLFLRHRDTVSQLTFGFQDILPLINETRGSTIPACPVLALCAFFFDKGDI